MKKIDIACVIDDDPIYVYGIKRLSEIAEFCNNLMVFPNGKEAYDNLKAILENGDKLPDVILLDINMPIWDGWQFLDEFTKIPIKKTIQIYMVSSSIDPEDIEKAKSYKEVNRFIVKPLSIDKLREIVEDL